MKKQQAWPKRLLVCGALSLPLAISCAEGSASNNSGDTETLVASNGADPASANGDVDMKKIILNVTGMT